MSEKQFKREGCEKRTKVFLYDLEVENERLKNSIHTLYHEEYSRSRECSERAIKEILSGENDGYYAEAMRQQLEDFKEVTGE